MAPALVVACLKAIDIISKNKNLILKLHDNTTYFRDHIKQIGYEIKGDSHPIVPIMIYDAKKAVALSEMLLEKNIYVIPFSLPVVPKDKQGSGCNYLPPIPKNNYNILLELLKNVVEPKYYLKK